jgi:large subunit ribosomal protein L9
MNIILLEKIRNLGNIGDQVKVKRGYWRNYLLPQSKAIMATQENLSKLTKMRAELEIKANSILQAAKDRATKLTNLILTIPVKTSEEGKLFGSVNIREIVHAAENQGVELSKKEISLPQGPIHQIGDYDVHVHLHSDVNTSIKVKVIPAAE